MEARADLGSTCLANIPVQMYTLCVQSIQGSRHAKTGLRAYANSEGAGQPAHTCNLIRGLAVHK